MTDDPTSTTAGPSRSVDLAAAIAAVVADVRAEDPDRAGMTDAEIVAETVASVDSDNVATLVEADLMSDEVADAYHAVLAAPRDHLDVVLTPASTTTDTHTHTADTADIGDTGDTGSRAGAADVVGGPEVVGLVCPECGQDAVEQPPTALTPYPAHGRDRPAYSHPDGEPLCPVGGPGGDQPALPVEILAEDPSQQTAADEPAPGGSAPAGALGGGGGTSGAAAGDNDPDGVVWRSELVVLDDHDLARMREALDRGDVDEAERVFTGARPFTPNPRRSPTRPPASGPTRGLTEAGARPSPSNPTRSTTPGPPSPQPVRPPRTPPARWTVGTATRTTVSGMTLWTRTGGRGDRAHPTPAAPRRGRPAAGTCWRGVAGGVGGRAGA